MDTVAQRLAKYQRRLRLHSVVAATLLAEVTVFAAVKFSEGGAARSWGSAVAGAIFLSMTVVTGFLLAVAHGATDWQVDLLLRNLPRTAGGTAPDVALLQPDTSMRDATSSVHGMSENWPGRERALFPPILILVLVLGLLLVAYSWLPVLPQTAETPPKPPRPEVVSLAVSAYFDVNRSTIPPSMRTSLEALARRVAPLPYVSVVVEGHADADYRSDYNLELSRSRAEAVKALLVAAGVDPSRITVLAHGLTRSSGPAASPARKAQDRRVDICANSTGEGAPGVGPLRENKSRLKP